MADGGQRQAQGGHDDGFEKFAAAGKGGEFLKAIIMTALGLALATIGQDPLSDITRFTFGSIDLLDGISFLLLAMATFALSEALITVLKRDDGSAQSRTHTGKLGALTVTRDEAKTLAPVVGRSSVLGFFIGVLPGAGATIASFLAYGMERNLAPQRDKKTFGKGSVRGLAAPETANNAACTGSFVPLLTLGIPGSGTTAVMLGALISYGVQPGPALFTERPEVFWSVIISMYIGNCVLLILNLPLIPYIARLLMLPKSLLVPMVLFFSLCGVYLVSFNTFDIHLMVIFAVGATGLRLLGFPMAPMILAFVLGKLMEENLRRALLISDGWHFLWERPTTLAIMGVTALIVLLPAINAYRHRATKQKTTTPP